MLKLSTPSQEIVLQSIEKFLSVSLTFMCKYNAKRFSSVQP